MIRQILVPLDGSALAESALPMASRLAQACGAALSLARVPDAIVAPMAGHEAETPLALSSPEARASARAYLERVAGEGQLVGLDPALLCPDPPVLTGLLEAIQSSGADLVVMSSHGYSGIRRLILGSVADGLARGAPCDVLVVPASPAAALGPGIEVISVPLDGSALSERALPRAAALAPALGARIHLLEIPDQPFRVQLDPDGSAVTDVLPALPDEAAAAADAYLEAQADALRALGVGVDVSQAPLGVEGLAQGILDAASRQGADLVMLASHGRGGLARMLLGSVTDALLRRSELPIWVVRGHPEDTARPIE